MPARKLNGGAWRSRSLISRGAARSVCLAAALAMGVGAGGAGGARAQVADRPSRPDQDARDVAAASELAAGLDAAAIGALRSRLIADLPRIVDHWIEIASIPAPSGREEARGARIEREMRTLGLDQVRRDEIGNTFGILRGRETAVRKIVYAAHLDTVARDGDPAQIERIGLEHLRGPGILDDASGLVALLEAVKALREAGLRPPNDVWILATAQEETGLLGARKFLDDHPGEVARFVAIDGTAGDIAYGSTGVRWLRFHFLGAGGHTMQSDRAPGPASAVAMAVRGIDRLSVPSSPPARASWLAVAMMGGGTVVNALPTDLWFTVDLRSNSPKMLAKLESQVRKEAARAADRAGVTVWTEELFSVRPIARPGAEHATLVRLAAAAIAAGTDEPARLTPTGTADHARALERGIPGICIGVTNGSAQHTPLETAAVGPIASGIATLVLLIVSLPAAD